MNKKRIMIVDDEAPFTRLLQLSLEQTGHYDVRTENNPLRAMQAAKQFLPDLVLMDVMMPVMDGVTFLKAVKQMPAYKFTPVIMLTTESEESKKREGQAAGARAWVVKPFQPEQLIGAVQRLCLP